MENSFQSSVDQDSCEVKDHNCNGCEDKNFDKSADFYCKQCKRFYCENCIHPHGQVFAKHNPIGKADLDQWPVSKKVVEFLQTCEVHTQYKLYKFCNAHRQMCCPKCVCDQHSQCTNLSLISECSQTQLTTMQPQPQSAEIQSVLEQLKDMQNNQETRMNSLLESYKKHEKSCVKQLRLNMNTILEEENSTVSASDAYKQNIEDKLCRSVLSVLDQFDNSITKELKEMQDEVTSLKESITSSILNCTCLQNDLKRFHESVQKVADNKELCFIVKMKSYHKIKQALHDLGKLDHVLTFHGKYETNIHLSSDSPPCLITGICVLPNELVLVTDCRNKQVKLLNQQYQLVCHWDVCAPPLGICQITPSEVAVTVSENTSHEVQFMKVNQSQLVPGRKFPLQHKGTCIAHHQGDLFICSGTALYKYTLSGKMTSKLYEKTSDEFINTVLKCAVSPTGDKLYILNWHHSELLTLTRDGIVLATFRDPIIYGQRGVLVTPAGQVLVTTCHFILQVSSDGRSRLAKRATGESMQQPHVVCYNSTTSSIIVAHRLSTTFLMLRVK